MLKIVVRVSAGTFTVILLLIATAILWPLSTAPLPESGRGYLIENIRVIDVEAGAASLPVSVVVRDGVVAAIGGRPASAGLVRVDGRGGFLAPGFWDMHFHAWQKSPQLDLPLMIANGVTNVRDMLDCPGTRDTLIACVSDKRRWTAEAGAGRTASPRFVEVASYHLADSMLAPAQVSARAAIYEARGLDALKVYDGLSRPAYFRAAVEARRRGMRLVGHLPKAVALDEAAMAGQSSFEHAHIFARHCFGRAADWRAGRLNGLSPTARIEAFVAEHDPGTCRKAFSVMEAAGAWYVPTHVAREEDARAEDPSFTRDPRLDYLDPLSRWAFRDDRAGTAAAYPGTRGRRALAGYFEHSLQLTGRAHEAGVRVLVGTDTGIGGFRYHDEMAHLVRAGLTPAEALRAATIEAARYARLDASSGSVAVGKRADLVLLDANPLADIANTRRIRAVFLNGRLYDRVGLDRLTAFVCEQADAPHNWAKLLWGFARSSVTSDL